MIANWMKVVGVLSSGAVIATVMASEPISGRTEPTAAPIVETTKLPETPKLPGLPKLPEVPKLPEMPKLPNLPAGKTSTADSSGCHPGYSGCLKQNVGDYDCAKGKGNGPNYTGRVEVYGSDPFDLDRDHDGIGCE